MIVTIRTDKPEAEVGLYQPDGTRVDYEVWMAHRELSNTLLAKIRDILGRQQLTFRDVAGIIVFQGPGSFTGLRIGITVANTFAYADDLPIIGAMGDDWQADGLRQLTAGENHRLILPHYGREAHVTQPRK